MEQYEKCQNCHWWVDTGEKKDLDGKLWGKCRGNVVAIQQNTSDWLNLQWTYSHSEFCCGFFRDKYSK